MVIAQGSPIPVFMRVVIGGLGLLAVLAYPLGLVLSLACLAAFGYTGGVELDAEGRRLREYSALFGLRWGGWQPLEKFKHVSVLHIRRSSTVQGRAGGSTDLQEMNHDVCLLDETHRKKFLVKSCDTTTEAEGLAIDVALKAGLDVVRFSPQPIRERRR